MTAGVDENAPARGRRVLVALLVATLAVPALAAAPDARADERAGTLARAERLDLAADPTWLKLLHFEPGAEFSSVLSDSFFLSPEGRGDPGAELRATITAWFEDAPADSVPAAPCRFPARYYWLDHEIGLPGYDLRATGCDRLERWALFDRTTSLSLLMVSGYLGNPASTFGHGLIKFNTDSRNDPSGLLDLTLNFGALVPENENPLVYIVRGLFGGYEAGFSDRHYYSQDLVYSRTEARDMWDYRLELTEYERTLLILHLWEITAKKFRYYFLEKNCGYRMAELIDLATPEEVMPHVHGWYLPESLFHRLEVIDAERLARGDPGLIRSVTYVPSYRRNLHARLALLADREIDTLNDVIEEGYGTVEEHLAGYAPDRQRALLDGLIAYQQFQLVSDPPDSNSPAWRDRDRLLLARLRRPAAPPTSAPVPELASPATGYRPLRLGLGAAHVEGGQDTALFSWSPFAKESVGQNSLEADELAVFDVALAVGEGSPAVDLERFDLVRVLSLKTLQTRLRGDRGWTWKLRLGIDRKSVGRQAGHEGTFRFGAGSARRLGARLTAYALLNLQAHTSWPEGRVAPEAGCIADLGRLRLRFEYGLESGDYEGKFYGRERASAGLRLSDQFEMRGDYLRDGGRRIGIGLARYF